MGTFEDLVTPLVEEDERDLKVHLRWLLQFGYHGGTDEGDQLLHEVSSQTIAERFAIAERLGGLATSAAEIIDRYEAIVFGEPNYGQA